MTKPSVYVETSIVSYLTARPSRDLIIAAQRVMTREWWRAARDRFVLVASELVLPEVAEGDTDAARARLTALDMITRLDTTEDATALTRRLLGLGAFPREATADAAHVSVAATNKIDYLLTWNLRRIASAAARSRIERACRQSGYKPPVICTPNEFMEKLRPWTPGRRNRSSLNCGPFGRRTLLDSTTTLRRCSGTFEPDRRPPGASTCACRRAVR